MLGGGSDAPPGGAETQIHLLSRGLAARGVRVCVVAYTPPEGLPARADGVDVIARPPPRWRSIPGPRGKLAEIATLLRTLARVDARVLVHRGTTMDIAFAALAAKARRRGFVYSSANTIDFTWGRVTSRKNALLYKVGIALADTVVVQTPEQVDLCERHFGRSPVLIKSIAEAAPRPAKPPEAFLWVGKLVSYKRPHAYLDLARAVPEARFRMVGVPDQHEGPALAREVERAAAEIPNLELLPPRPRDEVMSLFGAAVASVNTSDYEGMPNTFLEAWARGVPALALSHDPDGVIARERVGGFAGGSPERLAELARVMWRERGNQRELRGRCRDYVAREHHLDAVVDRWIDVLALAR